MRELERLKEKAVNTLLLDNKDDNYYEIPLDEQFFETHKDAKAAGAFINRNTWFAVGTVGAILA